MMTQPVEIRIFIVFVFRQMAQTVYSLFHFRIEGAGGDQDRYETERRSVFRQRELFFGQSGFKIV